LNAIGEGKQAFFAAPTAAASQGSQTDCRHYAQSKKFIYLMHIVRHWTSTFARDSWADIKHGFIQAGSHTYDIGAGVHHADVGERMDKLASRDIDM
jgi:hypothetical protein